MPVRPASPDAADERRVRQAWAWPGAVTPENARRRSELASPDREVIEARREYAVNLIRELRSRGEDNAQMRAYLGTGDSTVSPPRSEPALLCDDPMEESADRRAAEVAAAEPDTAPQPLQRSSIFREGAVFRGTQRVSRAIDRAGGQEDWGVVVTIHEIDLARGRCSGDMLAENVPLAQAPVVTHWEGELVDGLNHSFVTCKWGASYRTDFEHWRQFPAFAPLAQQVKQAHGRCNRLHQYPYIFMRWKERFFVDGRSQDGPGCSLTIAGFYYVCLSRESGRVEGFYYDPNSTPFQRLELAPASARPSLTSYKYA